MTDTPQPLIIVTNDDGIKSPGLLAAAQAVAPLGEVLVVAPREQQSSTGRSMPHESDGILTPVTDFPGGLRAFAAGGTPAQAVQHAVYELADRRPTLVVSGINYGENVGSGVTISGTVGAALEAAAYGIPALAVSQQTAIEDHRNYSDRIDWQAAIHFTNYFASRVLAQPLEGDVDILKIEIPFAATPETPWRVVRVAKTGFYLPVVPPARPFGEPGHLGYGVNPAIEDVPADTDIHVVHKLGEVAVTPLSLDLTARVSLADFAATYRD